MKGGNWKRKRLLINFIKSGLTSHFDFSIKKRRQKIETFRRAEFKQSQLS